MTFPEFLAWAATAEGINAIVGIVVSWVLDQWPKWGALPSFHKRLWLFVLSLVVPLLASLVGVLTGYADGTVENTWWPSAQAGMAAFVASQARHMLTLPKSR